MDITTTTACPYTHNQTKLILSTLLLVGIFLSYVPQLIAILRAKSSIGISPYFLLVANIASISTAVNIILLNSFNLSCCSTIWSVGTCFEQSIGVIQLVIQSLMMLTILLLYMRYFPAHLKSPSTMTETAPLLTTEPIYSYPNSPIHYTPNDLEQQQGPYYLWHISKRVATIVLVFLTLNSLIVAILFSIPAVSVNVFIVLAAIYGALATLMSCIQFVPQILHTYKSKDPGSLSILTMLIQTPGTIILIVYLASLPTTNISTYLSYVVAASSQGTLLCLSLYYMRKQQFGATIGPGVNGDDDDDRFPPINGLINQSDGQVIPATSTLIRASVFQDAESLLEDDLLDTPTNPVRNSSKQKVSSRIVDNAYSFTTIPDMSISSPVGSNVAVRGVSPDATSQVMNNNSYIPISTPSPVGSNIAVRVVSPDSQVMVNSNYLPVSTPSPVGSNIAVRGVSPDMMCFDDTVSASSMTYRTPSQGSPVPQQEVVVLQPRVKFELDTSPSNPSDRHPCNDTSRTLVHQDSKLVFDDNKVECTDRHPDSEEVQVASSSVKGGSNSLGIQGVMKSPTVSSPSSEKSCNKRKSTHGHNKSRRKHHAANKKW